METKNPSTHTRVCAHTHAYTHARRRAHRRVLADQTSRYQHQPDANDDQTLTRPDLNQLLESEPGWRLHPRAETAAALLCVYVCVFSSGKEVSPSASRTHHSVVEPLRDEAVQQFRINQVTVVQVETPEGEDHKLARRNTHQETHTLRLTHTHSPLPQGRPAQP